MISFADHVMKWLPEFALNHSELNEKGHHNAMRMTKKQRKLSTIRRNMAHAVSLDKYCFTL